MGWPVFAPIDLDFNQEKLRTEIEQSGILQQSHVSTTSLKDGKPTWDDGIHFQSQQFADLNQVPYWTEKNGQKVLTDHTMNTFFQVNATYLPELEGSQNLDEMWKYTESSGDKKMPLWITYHQPWSFRTDFQLPYLREIVNQLGLDFVTVIRILTQVPPSIGLIHKDSGPKTNQEYYDKGGVSITLNVCSGGGNLFYINSGDEECTIDEGKYKAWHFDDGYLHCTNSVSSLRMQLRIYGQHRDYKDKMKLEAAVY